jgi:methionine-rich copper-binding protein CopC
MGAILAGSLVFTAPFGVFGAAVSAHATLDRSVPAAGAVLTTPPRQVDLYFGETLADPGGASFAVVLDASGRTVSGADRGDPADARHLIAPINGALDDGSYTVFWKSTSASDGGATLGDFAFNVGATAASPQPGTGGQVPVPDAMRARALTASDGGGAGGWLAGGAIGVVVGAAVTVGIVDIRARRAAAVDKRRATGRRR